MRHLSRENRGCVIRRRKTPTTLAALLLALSTSLASPPATASAGPVRDALASVLPTVSSVSVTNPDSTRTPSAAIGASSKETATPSSVQTFSYKAEAQTFVAPYTGRYRLDVWGAIGGSGNGNTLKTQSSHAGWGGHSWGYVELTQGETLYVFTGGKGVYGAGSSAAGGPLGGYNGGGNGGNSGSGSGGGMTHISKTNNPVPATGTWSYTGTLIVAGGGGGSDNASTAGTATGTGHDDGSGGDGGGLEGAPGYKDGILCSGARFVSPQVTNGDGCGMGGSQTEGYARGHGEDVTRATDTGGGGGGWWGGYTTNHNNGGAGGGSGYVGGVLDGHTEAGVWADAGKASITLANELIVDPNGGTWTDEDGQTWGTGPGVAGAERHYWGFSGSVPIPDPTREGYRFVGWAEVGSGHFANIFGSYGDGAFADASNNVRVYNNRNNGSVTHERVSLDTPYGQHAIRISHDAILESQPALGGFHIATTVSPSHRYLMVFSARLPAGYFVHRGTNKIGDGGYITWLTDRAGTGEWRTYAQEIVTGPTGTFTTTGFTYLLHTPDGNPLIADGDVSAAAEAVSWEVAYAEFYDITNGYSYDLSTGESRIIAQWEPVSYKVAYHHRGDDDYKPGQADTLGTTIDLGRAATIRGTVMALDAGSVLLAATTDGEGDIAGTVAADGRLTLASGGGASTSTATAAANTASQPFSMKWNQFSREWTMSLSTNELVSVTRQVPGDGGTSENEMRIGAADWSRPYAAVHVSDVTWEETRSLSESFPLPHPTRIGYRFLGWDTEEDGTGTRYAANQSVSRLASEGTVDLYAQWELRSYVVSFDANGGAGAMPSQDFMWNEEKGLSHCSMLRFNWKFTGWNTEADGSGTSYEDDQVVKNILEKPVVTENDYRITLYAQWEKVSNTSQIEDGLWEIRVPAWGKVSVSNLPAGASFEVVEQPQQDWVLTSQENTSGTIVPRVTEVAKFQNEYRPNETSLALAATKTLDGTSPVGSDFSFTLSGADEQTTAKITASLGGEPTETVSNNGGGIQFSPVIYNRDDIGKTFTYLIQEIEGDDPTIAYTTVTKTVTVNVTTGATGLIATAEYPDLEGQTAVFANRTKPGSLRVVKEITHGTEAAREKSLFPITVALSDSLGTPVSGSYEVTRNGITVAGAEFDDEGKTTVSIADGDELVVSGIPAGTRYSVIESYPDWFRQTEVEGTDGVIQPDTQSEASFANEYLASGQATIVAEKHLLGAVLAADEFSFRLLDEDGSVIGVATNAEDGTVEFPPIAYGAEDDGKTYRYVIAEDDEGREDVAYDGHEENVTVSVSDDDGTGELAVSVAYDDPSGATFENAKIMELATTGDDGTRDLGIAAGIGVVAVAVAASRRRKVSDASE